MELKVMEKVVTKRNNQNFIKMTTKELISKLYNKFYDVSSHPHCVKIRHNIAVKAVSDFILDVQQELDKKPKWENIEGKWINQNKDEN